MAPLGAVFVVASLTDGITVPSSNRTGKDKSKIALNFRDLWGIIASGDIFNSGGGLCLMSSHATIRACPLATFSATSARSCSMASGCKADMCGPLSIAACISSTVQCFPVCVGQPRVAYALRIDAAGWCNASPRGHMLFRYEGKSDNAGGGTKSPWCVFHHCISSGCSDCSVTRVCLLSLRNALVVAPVTIVPSWRRG